MLIASLILWWRETWPWISVADRRQKAYTRKIVSFSSSFKCWDFNIKPQMINFSASGNIRVENKCWLFLMRAFNAHIFQKCVICRMLFTRQGLPEIMCCQLNYMPLVNHHSWVKIITNFALNMTNHFAFYVLQYMWALSTTCTGHFDWVRSKWNKRSIRAYTAPTM